MQNHSPLENLSDGKDTQSASSSDDLSNSNRQNILKVFKLMKEKSKKNLVIMEMYYNKILEFASKLNAEDAKLMMEKIGIAYYQLGVISVKTARNTSDDKLQVAINYFIQAKSRGLLSANYWLILLYSKQSDQLDKKAAESYSSNVRNYLNEIAQALTQSEPYEFKLLNNRYKRDVYELLLKHCHTLKNSNEIDVFKNAMEKLLFTIYGDWGKVAYILAKGLEESGRPLNDKTNELIPLLYFRGFVFKDQVSLYGLANYCIGLDKSLGGNPKLTNIINYCRLLRLQSTYYKLYSPQMISSIKNLMNAIEKYYNSIRSHQDNPNTSLKIMMMTNLVQGLIADDKAEDFLSAVVRADELLNELLKLDLKIKEQLAPLKRKVQAGIALVQRKLENESKGEEEKINRELVEEELAQVLSIEFADKEKQKEVCERYVAITKRYLSENNNIPHTLIEKKIDAMTKANLALGLEFLTDYSKAEGNAHELLSKSISRLEDCSNAGLLASRVQLVTIFTQAKDKFPTYFQSYYSLIITDLILAVGHELPGVHYSLSGMTAQNQFDFYLTLKSYIPRQNANHQVFLMRNNILFLTAITQIHPYHAAAHLEMANLLANNEKRMISNFIQYNYHYFVAFLHGAHSAIDILITIYAKTAPRHKAHALIKEDLLKIKKLLEADITLNVMYQPAMIEACEKLIQSIYLAYKGKQSNLEVLKSLTSFEAALIDFLITQPLNTGAVHLEARQKGFAIRESLTLDPKDPLIAKLDQRILPYAEKKASIKKEEVKAPIDLPKPVKSKKATSSLVSTPIKQEEVGTSIDLSKAVESKKVTRSRGVSLPPRVGVKMEALKRAGIEAFWIGKSASEYVAAHSKEPDKKQTLSWEKPIEMVALAPAPEKDKIKVGRITFLKLSKDPTLFENWFLKTRIRFTDKEQKRLCVDMEGKVAKRLPNKS